jgi:hypothetical protein
MDHSPVHGARTARDLGRYRCTAVDACAREGRCVSRQASVFEEQSIALSIEAPGPHCRFRVTCKQADGLGPRLQLTRLVPERSHHIYGHRHSGAGSCCSPSARVVGNGLTPPPPRTFGRAGEVRLRNDGVGMASPRHVRVEFSSLVHQPLLFSGCQSSGYVTME